MAVSQMQKVQILTHNSHRASLIKDLQNLEIIHINNLNEQKETIDETLTESEIRNRAKNIQNDLTRIGSAIDYLANFEQKQGFLAGFLGGKPVLSFQEYSNLKTEIDGREWRDVCDECQNMQDQSAKLISLENRLYSERENLIQWSNLDAPVEQIRDTEKTEVRIGIVPISTYDNLINEAKSSNLDILFEVIGKSRNDVNILVIFLNTDEQDVIPLLSRHGFSQASLPITAGKISDRLMRIDEEISEILAQRKQISEKSQQLAGYRTKLMAIYDYMSELLSQEGIRESFLNTDYVFMIDGWVRRKDIKKLRDDLSKKYSELEIVVSDPLDDDEPPVDLNHGKLASPYQMVTKLYGLPQYKEIDPTSLLAPFLTLGFAICLTDAGYGIFVALISLLALSRKGGGNRKLFGILLVCGISTLVIGALTGGWFGISPDKLPGFLLKLRVIDPNTQQLLFLSLIVAVGYIQVWFGYVVKMYICLKDRDWVGFFADQLSWVLTMILAPIWILMAMGRIDAPSIITSIVKVIVGICLLAILLFSGREIKNPAGRIGTGFFELYSKVTGTFGDTLSYLRLFALGLATGIIASSINVIAGMLWTSPIGKVGAILVLIFGHPFNIVINSLGGFIHSTRLQFVEFFTKFYEGGGKEFQPFRKEHTYITVLDVEKS